MDEKTTAALREVFEAWARERGSVIRRHVGIYSDFNTQARWEGFLACYQHLAPIVEDADRYRWLIKRLAGYDFNWMPSSECANDGKTVAVFDMGPGFRGGTNIGALIDAAREQEKKTC